MRKASIPQREIQVLKRLREAREKLGFAQVEFAAQVGITKGRLANFEYQKTPLPCDLALRFCHQFIIGERWLATGQGPMRQYLALAGKPLVFRLPYGEAYDKALSQEATKLALEMEEGNSLFAMSPLTYWNPKNRQFYKNFLNAVFDNWIEALSERGIEDEAGDFVEMLTNSGYEHLGWIFDREPWNDPKTHFDYWRSRSTGKLVRMNPRETESEAAARWEKQQLQSEQSKKIWDRTREEIARRTKAKK